jgi:hypothetical protein
MAFFLIVFSFFFNFSLQAEYNPFKPRPIFNMPKIPEPYPNFGNSIANPHVFVQKLHYLGAEHAGISKNEGWVNLYYHKKSFEEQLKEGVRYADFPLSFNGNDIVVALLNDSMTLEASKAARNGSEPITFAHYLKNIKDFIDTYPGEILLIKLSLNRSNLLNQENEKQWMQIFHKMIEDSGLKDHIFKIRKNTTKQGITLWEKNQGYSLWPRVSDVREQNRRVLFFVDHKNIAEASDVLNDAGDYLNTIHYTHGSSSSLLVRIEKGYEEGRYIYLNKLFSQAETYPFKNNQERLDAINQKQGDALYEKYIASLTAIRHTDNFTDTIYRLRYENDDTQSISRSGQILSTVTPCEGIFLKQAIQREIQSLNVSSITTYTTMSIPNMPMEGARMEKSNSMKIEMGLR